MPDLFERVMLLKRSRIFMEVEVDDLRLVADKMEEQKFTAGSRVFDKGDFGEDMYLIVEGSVGIMVDPRSADDYIVTLSSGDGFGEMNLLDEQPRSATAVVLEDSRLLVLGKQKLRGLILSYPELALGMLKALSLNLRNTTSMLEK